MSKWTVDSSGSSILSLEGQLLCFSHSVTVTVRVGATACSYTQIQETQFHSENSAVVMSAM